MLLDQATTFHDTMDNIIKKDQLENVNFFAKKFLGVNILRGAATQITVG